MHEALENKNKMEKIEKVHNLEGRIWRETLNLILPRFMPQGVWRMIKKRRRRKLMKSSDP